MDFGIRGKTALITGASAGIGEAVALALAAEGANVAVAARRAKLLESVAARCKAAGATGARAFTVDQTDSASITKLAHDVETAFGAIDILVINGGGPKTGTYSQMQAADWDAAYVLTLQSALRMVGAVLPQMRARKWGRIVALESTSVKQPIAQLTLSNTFRTAVVAALKTLAGEVASEGITVNTIATGRIDTERFRSVYAERPGGIAQAHAGVPFGRAATPDEFAPLVAFLCGEPAKYVTGQTIAIDGGLTVGLFG